MVYKHTYGLHTSKKWSTIYKQASYNTKALFWIRRYLTSDKASMQVQACILLNVFYSLIIWIFFKKSSTKLINKIRRRALCILNYRFDLSLSELRQLSTSFSIRSRDLLSFRWRFLNQ